MEPKIKILFLAANPVNTVKLQLEKEVRSIREELERSKFRDSFEFIYRGAARVSDLSRALLDYQPQIVHFSGHGQGNSIITSYYESDSKIRDIGTEKQFSSIHTEGLVFEDDYGQAQLVRTFALADLFELFKHDISCVILNACYSKIQADAIYQHIDCVVGMSSAVGNEAAIKFSSEFYKALAAGYSFDFAFKFGKNSLDLSGVKEAISPILHNRFEIDDPFNVTTSDSLPKSLTSQPYKTTNIDVGGSISGSIIIGDNNITHINPLDRSINHVADKAADLATLKQMFIQLKKQISDKATVSENHASEHFQELEKAIMSDNLDYSNLENIKCWFVNNVPEVASLITSFIEDPLIHKLNTKK